jgi:hypothetical protein
MFQGKYSVGKDVPAQNFQSVRMFQCTCSVRKDVPVQIFSQKGVPVKIFSQKRYSKITDSVKWSFSSTKLKMEKERDEGRIVRERGRRNEEKRMGGKEGGGMRSKMTKSSQQKIHYYGYGES